jgi:hypothetical protein
MRRDMSKFIRRCFVPCSTPRRYKVNGWC